MSTISSSLRSTRSWTEREAYAAFFAGFFFAALLSAAF